MPICPRRPSADWLAISLLVLSLSGPAAAAGPERVRAEDAHEHVGERVSVCGRVVDTAYLPHLRGEPTYLNLERPYPDPAFTVVIWGQYRSTFRQSPDEFYLNKDICVTGVVSTYRKRPQIQVQSPEALTVMDPGLDADRFSPEERAVIRATLVALGYGAEDPGEWTDDTDQALAAFQADQGLSGDAEEWPQTLRALAEEASAMNAEQSLAIVRLFLLHLSQRETRVNAE